MLKNYIGSKSGTGKSTRLLTTFLCTTFLFFLCSGKGRAQGSVTFDPPVFNQITNATYPKLDTWGIALLDLEGDGDLDIAAAARTISNFEFRGCVGILKNDGSGVFTLVTNFPISTPPYRIISADQNNDGFPDLISINNPDPECCGNSISLWLNDGFGNFGTRADYIVRDQPNNAVSADFNKDDLPDIATASNSGITVLLSLGSGALGTTNHVIGSGNGIASGDFDEDGILDLVTTTPNFRILFLKGIGDGEFAPFQTVATNVYAFKVVAADLNKDGHLDLVVSSAVSDNGFFAGNGDGTFQQRISLLNNGASNRLTLADLNGDGWTDPIFAYGGVTAFLNSEQGEFTRRNVGSGGGISADLQSGDLNGDGRPDLVSAGWYTTNNVVIYFNRSLPALDIRSSPTILSWPTWPNYSLEYTPDLSNPNWLPETGTSVENGGVNTLAVPGDTTNRFWRLRSTE